MVMRENYRHRSKQTCGAPRGNHSQADLNRRGFQDGSESIKRRPSYYSRDEYIIQFSFEGSNEYPTTPAQNRDRGRVAFGA